MYTFVSLIGVKNGLIANKLGKKIQIPREKSDFLGLALYFWPLITNELITG